MLIFDREGEARSRTLRVRLPVFAEPVGRERERERLRLRGRGLPAVGWTPVRLRVMVLKSDMAGGASVAFRPTSDARDVDRNKRTEQC